MNTHIEETAPCTERDPGAMLVDVELGLAEVENKRVLVRAMLAELAERKAILERRKKSILDRAAKKV